MNEELRSLPHINVQQRGGLGPEGKWRRGEGGRGFLPALLQDGRSAFATHALRMTHFRRGARPARSLLSARGRGVGAGPGGAPRNRAGAGGSQVGNEEPPQPAQVPGLRAGLSGMRVGRPPGVSLQPRPSREGAS